MKSVPARLCCLALLAANCSAGDGASAQEASTAAEAGGQVQTVTVTARKREEPLAQVPASVTAFTAQTLLDYNVQTFTDYATKTSDLSFTYGTGPTGIAAARTIAIRGITGQNFFGTAGATGFYIDDTPVPGSIDPRVVDLARIEVLKGPQGTLFGESSLAGNVRLITRGPDPTQSGYGYTADVGVTSGGGSPTGGASFIGNVAVSANAAVRLVLFADHDAGYLTRTYPSEPGGPGAGDPFASVARTSVGDQGAISTAGGSLAMLLKVTDSLDVRVRVIFQASKDHGFPATFAPLPAFSPVYELDRAFDVQPYATDTWTLPSIDLKWSGAGYSVVWTNSYFYRHIEDVEDSSYGTQQVLTGGYYNVVGLPPQPYLWAGLRYHNQFTSEARLSFEPIHKLSGTLGLYYANVRTRFTIPPTYAQGLTNATVGGEPAVNVCTPACQGDLIWTQTDPGSEEDKSIFGELYWNFLPSWTMTFGARQYWLDQSTDFIANGFLNLGPTPSAPQSNSQSGFSPKVALSVQVSEAVMAYASASKGFRAGGAQPFLTFCSEPALPVDDITHLKSDTLWSYELGAKAQLADVFLSAAAYHIDWTNLQQQVALPCGYYLQVNGDRARVNGGEFEADGQVAARLDYRVGLGYEDASITDPGPLGSVGIEPGSRIGGVPAFTAFVGMKYAQMLDADTSAFVATDYSYTGNSVSLLVSGGGAQATRAAYSLVNFRFGVQRGQSELSFNLHNLFNAKPNLGDIGYVGYAQFDAAGGVIPQVATLQPLTATLRYARLL